MGTSLGAYELNQECATQEVKVTAIFLS